MDKLHKDFAKIYNKYKKKPTCEDYHDLVVKIIEEILDSKKKSPFYKAWCNTVFYRMIMNKSLDYTAMKSGCSRERIRQIYSSLLRYIRIILESILNKPELKQVEEYHKQIQRLHQL